MILTATLAASSVACGNLPAVLGMQQGATENAAAVEDLLEQLVARGVDPKAKRLL